jgi:dTDP-4-amino-4,6-dideoxygalactose transaminase
MKAARVPVFDLRRQHEQLKEGMTAAFNRCLEHQGFCLGPEVAAFESEIAGAIRRRHAVGLNSGTSALHLAARLLNLGPGDEVVTTAMSFVATAAAIHYVGARPVFADIERGTMNLDPAAAEAAITPRTKAIFAVDLYGQCAVGPALEGIAGRHGLALVEDASQALGAWGRDRPAGSFGRMSVLSFYPGKNLGACGEAGLLATDDPGLAERAAALRNHGSVARYAHDEIGYNYRMDGIQAAILRVKLPHLDSWVGRRREIASLYRRELASLPLELPAEGEGQRPAYHQFVIRHPERDKLRAWLADAGIGTGIHYPAAVPYLGCFKHLGHGEGEFPVAERTARECISLPMFPELATEQVLAVSAAIRGYFGA